jgi:hypothetical protein
MSNESGYSDVNKKVGVVFFGVMAILTLAVLYLYSKGIRTSNYKLITCVFSDQLIGEWTYTGTAPTGTGTGGDGKVKLFVVFENPTYTVYIYRSGKIVAREEKCTLQGSVLKIPNKPFKSQFNIKGNTLEYDQNGMSMNFVKTGC